MTNKTIDKENNVDIHFGVITGGEVMDDSNRMYVNIPKDKGITTGLRIAYILLPKEV